MAVVEFEPFGWACVQMHVRCNRFQFRYIHIFFPSFQAFRSAPHLGDRL